MLWVAWLRGINVGTTKRMRMADLRDALEGAGLSEVRTYVQSGNVLLEDASRDEAGVAVAVHDVVEERFGWDVAVIVRSVADLAAVAGRDPFAGADDEPKRSFVGFLAEPLGKATAKALLEPDWGEERLAIDGRELHLWLPGGTQGSPLGKAVAKAAGQATMRNRTTIAKVLALAEG